MKIGITGYATSGKDEVAGVLEREFGFARISWADALRRDIRILNPIVGLSGDGETVRYQDALGLHGYNESKKLFPEFRRLLQTYGTETHRSHDENYWIKRALESIPRGADAVFPDTRFPNEAEAVDFMIGIRRPGVTAVNEHASDAGLAFSYVSNNRWIDNDGTLEDLAKKTRDLYYALTF